MAVDGISALALPLHSASLDGTEEIIVTVGGVVKRSAVSLLGITTYGGTEPNAPATLSVTTLASEVTNATAGNINVALPNGTNGQIKIVTATSLINTVTITSANGIGWSSIVLTNTGNGVILYYFNGWRIVGKNIG